MLLHVELRGASNKARITMIIVSASNMRAVPGNSGNIKFQTRQVDIAAITSHRAIAITSMPADADDDTSPFISRPPIISRDSGLAHFAAARDDQRRQPPAVEALEALRQGLWARMRPPKARAKNVPITMER